MFYEFIKRENEIFDILNEFLENKLTFVIIGGYAVSAFKHRFSMDVDVVISSDDVKKFEGILHENGFRKTISKDIKDVYSSRFIRFGKGRENKVSIDLLVDGVSVRQTGASFGFDLLLRNSNEKRIIGSEKEIVAKIPKKEILIAMKIHSGRLTDFRDIAALSKDIDIGLIKNFVSTGDQNGVREHLDKLKSIVETEDFINSFKGVFAEKGFDVDIDAVKRICSI